MKRGEKFTPVTATRRLLLATDGQPHSEGAVKGAIKLAKRRSSTLHVMTVTEKARTAGASEMLGAIKDAALKEGITCTTSVAHGDPTDAIVKEAEKKRVDLIIMGRRGLDWLTKTIKGSVISKVMEQARCNVLVVPKEADIECRAVLVATDGSPLGRTAGIAAISFARQCGGRLVALSAMQDEGDRETALANVDKVVEQARLDDVSVETMTPIGKPVDTIVQAARDTDASLVVIGGFRKTRSKRFFTGSIVEKVVESAGCAVLVVKAER